jgi:hypothetical protein
VPTARSEAVAAWTLLQAGGQIQIAACHPFVDAVATPVLIIEVRILNVAWANSFFALARKVQKKLEDVDEVQVERERPEHGELLLRFSVEILGVLLLNRLGMRRIVGVSFLGGRIIRHFA